MRNACVLLVLGAGVVVGCRGGDGPAASAPQPNAAPAPARPESPAATAGPKTWSFDGDDVGKAPAGFAFGRTGAGRVGRWEVVADPTAASSPHVLAQLDADSADERFPVAAADAPVLRDVRLSVRCKPVSGEVDQAVGLVFRHRDENDYYLTRANALESNVRLYFVKDGRRQQIATWNGSVATGAWHDYKVEARGDHFEVWWDGAKVIDHRDGTFPDAGKVGVWTKADSVSYFDDLTVEGL